MPTSVNASHTVGKGFKDKSGKWRKVVVRSPEYTDWLEWAGLEWRKQFPRGVAEKFTGRLRVDYLFVFTEGTSGAVLSDIGNREKVLSDFLQHKFFENDKQIDEQHQFRRLTKHGKPRVIVRVTEIPDRRFEPFEEPTVELY